jgi:iron(III) transport system substrate-binding protein
MDNFIARIDRRKFILKVSAGLIGAVVLKGQAANAESSSTLIAQNKPVASGNEAKLYEAAKKEGKLVYYTVFFNQEVVNEIGAAFMKRYPGIQFEGTRKVASALFQQVNQEMQAGKLNVDVFGTTDLTQMLKLDESEKLLNYVPIGKDKLIPAYRNFAPKDSYQVGALIPIVIGVNTQKMKLGEAPKSWKDLTKSQFSEKIATGSGAASGQVGTWAIAISKKYGWDSYFPAFNKLSPKLGRSINDAVTDLVSGERAVAIVTQGQTLDAKAKGNPVDVIYPTDGAVILVGPVAILKEAPHPNAAKLFMNFMMSEEYSKLAAKHYEQPLRADVKVANLKPLTELKPVTLSPAEIKEGIPKIRDQWKDLFGA